MNTTTNNNEAQHMKRNSNTTTAAPTTGAAIAREVNKRIKAMGRNERLVAGRGYCYFIDGDAMRWYTSSVHVPRIADQTVEQWLADLQLFIAGAR
jgi:hypothetical protein